MTQDTVSDELPNGIALTPLDEAFREDPYAVLRRVQGAVQVLPDPLLGRYIYTHHDDVKTILRDKTFWSDPRKANEGTFHRQVFAPQLEKDEAPSMLMMDEPDHRRLRSLVSAAFTPAAVERWRPRTKAVIKRILDDIKTDEFDLIEDFAGPVPTVVIAELLGIDPQMHGDFKHWSDNAVKVGFNPFASTEEKAVGEASRAALDTFFHEQIEHRRREPGDDLISQMLAAELEGETLNEGEIVRQCNLLLVAGNVTTTDLIGNGVNALLRHPAQLALLRAQPGRITQAVEEMLRFDSPVINSGRIASHDVEIGGCPVGKGESLSVSLAAANRDPAIYEDPDTFDISRSDNHHQSFGGGRHLCLGAHLARMEAQEAILGLLARYPNLVRSEQGCEFHAIPGFRGYACYWVKSE